MNSTTTEKKNSNYQANLKSQGEPLFFCGIKKTLVDSRACKFLPNIILSERVTTLFEIFTKNFFRQGSPNVVHFYFTLILQQQKKT